MKPTPAPYQGRAWPQHAVPRKISMRHGAVAMPALTSAPQGRILHPRQLVCTAWRQQGPPVSETSGDGGRTTSRTHQESAEPFPGAHAPLIKMRWGVATVIARQAAGLLP